MKNPLVNICIAFCLGIIAAVYLKIPLVFFYICAVIFTVSSIVLRRNHIANILILCVVFSLGACMLKNSQILPESHIAKLTPYKGRYVYLKGIVDTDPILKKDRTQFVLKTEDVLIMKKLHNVSGEVLVTVFGRRNFSYGDKLILNGKLYRPFNFDISERLNYRDYLKRKGIYSLLSVKKDGFIERIGGNYGNPIKIFAFKAKRKMKKIILDNLSNVPASILNAMLLGDRKGVPRFVNDALARSGTIHILAVSGLHVGIVAFIIIVFLKIIRIPRKPRFIITMILLVFYAVLTGARPSIIRATTMILVLLLGYLIEREPDIYNSLSLAALIILGVNPNQVFDIGFQLSFVSVFSICWISPKIKNLFPRKWFRNIFSRFFLMSFCVSSSAWLGTMGLVAYYFKILTPVAVLANMILVPFMMVIIAAGFSLVVAGGSLAFFASLIAPVCALLLALMFKLNVLLINIPGAYLDLPLLPAYLVAIYYVMVFIAFRCPKIFRSIPI